METTRAALFNDDAAIALAIGRYDDEDEITDEVDESRLGSRQSG